MIGIVNYCSDIYKKEDLNECSKEELIEALESMRPRVREQINLCSTVSVPSNRPDLSTSDVHKKFLNFLDELKKDGYWFG